MTSPAKFLREVRQEMHKVTWPTRRETMASTALVLVLSAVAAILFMVVDSLLGSAVSAVLGLGK
jgi:preprotein translocase subunit SecE